MRSDRVLVSDLLLSQTLAVTIIIGTCLCIQTSDLVAPGRLPPPASLAGMNHRVGNHLVSHGLSELTMMIEKNGRVYASHADMLMHRTVTSSHTQCLHISLPLPPVWFVKASVEPLHSNTCGKVASHQPTAYFILGDAVSLPISQTAKPLICRSTADK